MFTGIIQGTAEVVAIDPRDNFRTHVVRLPEALLPGLEPGASVAHNGCCLTVVEFDDTSWVADAVPETLARTNIGGLRAGDVVNLERPLAANGRYGGHVVQGHVDATTTVQQINELDDGSHEYTFELPPTR